VDSIPLFSAWLVFLRYPKVKGVVFDAPLDSKRALYWQEILIQVEISYIIGSIFSWYAVNNFFTVGNELV